MNKTKLAALCVATIVATGFGVYVWKYQDWVAIPKARAPLIAYLKDPLSAQFRNERVAPSGALCGEVNSKNSMGGYVGFKRYILAGSEANYLEDAGTLGSASTPDMIMQLKEQNAVLRSFVDLRKDNPDFPVPPEAKLAQLALENFFNHKWEAMCGANKG